MRRLDVEYGEAIDVSDVGPQKEGRGTPAVRTLDFRVGFAISERSLPDPEVRGIGGTRGCGPGLAWLVDLEIGSVEGVESPTVGLGRNSDETLA